MKHESRRFRIASVYAEMNDFCINPEAWFFEVFAYERYGGPGNDDHWLAEWQSAPNPPMLITGLERLQEVYASDAWHDRVFTDAADVAELLVVIRFQDLIRRAVRRMKLQRCPFLATAHDALLLYEFGGTSLRRSGELAGFSGLDTPLDYKPSSTSLRNYDPSH